MKHPQTNGKEFEFENRKIKNKIELTVTATKRTATKYFMMMSIFDLISFFLDKFYFLHKHRDCLRVAG